MAAINNERKREEIFFKIMKYFHEYSNENITDFRKAKVEIVELLKNHRPVKLVDYEFGISHALKENQRLIVKEENDKTKVREYTTKQRSTYWYCTFSGSLRVKCLYSAAKVKYGILFASLNHAENCTIKEYSYVLQVQNALKQKRLMAIYKQGVSQSSSTSMFNESTISTTEIQNEMNHVETNLNYTNAFANAVIAFNTLSSPGPLSSSLLATENFSRVERDADDNDYCMMIDYLPAKKPKIEPNNEEIYSFDLPSAVVLKEKCEKLKIGYNKEAYKFWGQIEFNKIVAVSDKIHTHEFKSPNIFACLSLLFTGKSDSCFFIQHSINSAYRDELSTSSSMTVIESDQIFTCTSVSDDLIEFIATFLECRIGIYENGKLKKYGKWESWKKNVLTLVMSFEKGLYSILFNL